MKKGLIAALIAANVVMFVIAVLTIPPNLRASAGKKAPAPKTEKTAPATLYPKEELPPAIPESDNLPAPGKTGANFSTEERPDLEDFLWYTEDVAYNGVPAGVKPISNIASLTGGWKAFIHYDPNNEYDSAATEFLNISLAGTADSLSLTLDWYHIFWEGAGESIDETDMEDSVFNGKWENSGLWASGPGTIRLTQFYEQNGKQYAVGTMDTPDGIPALVAMVRP
ncbi:MAG: hypothetical protein ACOX66_07045 [Oscillospiraceae bacterium]|jgi:hypothetical protein